jgi:hypothetical protein
MVETRLNFASLRFEVCGIRFATPEDAAAASLEHVLRANQEDPTQAQVLAEHFIDANRLRSSAQSSSSSATAVSGLSPQALAHEAYNTAYTLKVLASNMRLKAVAMVEPAAAAEEDDDEEGDSDSSSNSSSGSNDGDSDDASRFRRRTKEEGSAPAAAIGNGKPERHKLPLSDGPDAVAAVVRALCKQSSRRRRQLSRQQGSLSRR